MQEADCIDSAVTGAESTSDDHESAVCIPGAQARDVRSALGDTSLSLGLRSFDFGTEIRGPREEIDRAIGRMAQLSGTADYRPIAVSSTADRYLETLVERLKQAGVFLVSAESCTAGLVSGGITEVPGSSSVLWGGFVVYSNEAKVHIGVSPATIESHGAVSRETVQSLVEASLARTPANTAVAVSGIAGPEGGTDEKPLGTVWVAAATRGGTTIANRRCFSGSRAGVRLLAVGACHEAIMRVSMELTEA